MSKDASQWALAISDTAEGKAIPWVRIGAEGAAIVVSILLAFAIDAWWGSQQDLALEREHLAALSVQFDDAIRMVAGESAQVQDAAAAARWLLSLQPEEAMAAHPDTLAQSFVRLLSVGRVNLPSGALDALMASGNLGMIRDAQLVAKLAAWPSAVSEAYENASWLVEHREGAFAPFLSRYAGGLWTAGRSGLLNDYPDTRFPPQVAAMFSDQTLESHLANTAIRLQLLLDRYSTLHREADSIIVLIRQRLARDAS